MANGPELARAYVTILPDMTGAARSIERQLGGVDTNRVGRTMGDGVGNSMAGRIKSLIGPALALASSAAVGAFAKATIAAAADMQQSIGAVDSVFKDSSKQIHAWAKDSAKNVGISANSYNELATLIGSQLKNGGTAIEEIGGKTNDLIGLGADLSSMFGGEASEAVAALSSALKGERDPIERYGVSLNQAKIDAEAAALGFEKVGSTLSAEANQAATLSLIMKQTADAHGNFARETDTLSNRQQVLNAMWADGKARLGEDLLPAATAVTSALIAGLAPALDVTSGAIKGAIGFLGGFYDGLIQTDEGVAKTGIALWAENLGYSLAEMRPQAQAVFTEVSGGFKAMSAAFKAGDGEVTSSGFAGFLEIVGNVAREVWDVLAPAFKELGPQVLELLTTLSPLGIIFKALQPVLPQLGAAIGALAKALGGVLAAVLPVVVDLVGTLVEALSGTLATILPVVAELLTTVGTVLADTLVALLPAIVPLIELVADAMVTLMPVIAQLVSFIGGALGDVLVQIMPVILTLATTVGTVLGAALDIVVAILPIFVDIAMQLITALLPLIPAILEIVTALLPLIPVVLQLVTALLPVWIDLMNLLIPVVVWLIDLLVAFLVPVITTLADGLVWLVGKIGDAVTWFTNLATSGTSLKTTLTNAWTSIKDGLSTAWTWIKDNVFAPFTTGIEALGTAFETVKGIISTAWTAIQDAATGPVNFIIETVYTNGIKKLFDTVAEKLGLDLRLPTVSKINTAPPAPLVAGSSRPTSKGQFAFAAGGVLPGYTPGRDVHEFYSATGGRLSLSGGEAIMRPEFTKAVGGVAGVHRLNQAAIKGQAFAGGGVWGWVKDKLGDAWDFTTNAAGAVANFMKDPIKGALEVISKPVEALFSQIGGGDVGKMLTGAPKAILDGIVSSAKSIFGEPRVEESANPSGAGAGIGASVGGFNPMGVAAMRSALQQLIPGARVTSALRPGDPNMHGKGRAIDIGNPTMERFNKLLAAYPNAYQLLYSPANARQITWAGKRGNTSGALRADHFDHIHWAMKNGGVIPKVYDNGGWLPPGGMAINTSTRPEPVFSGEQWDKVNANGLKDGDTIILNVDGQQMTGYVQVVARGEIESRQRDMSGRRGRA